MLNKGDERTRTMTLEIPVCMKSWTSTPPPTLHTTTIPTCKILQQPKLGPLNPQPRPPSTLPPPAVCLGERTGFVNWELKLRREGREWDLVSYEADRVR